MNNNIKMMTLMLAGGFMLPVGADDTGFEPRWYGGIGFGASRLDPDTNNTGFSVLDDSSIGKKLFGGYDWSDKLSLELHYTDIGEVDLSPNGSIGYKNYGLSGLYYFYNRSGDRAQKLRQDLSFFGKAGVGFMKNKSSVPNTREDDSHIMLGAGVEYGLKNGFALRAEIELFEKDAQFYSFSILKRFGKTRTTIAKSATVLSPVPIEKKVTKVLDSDNDGIFDPQDNCPKTRAGAKVDAKGCQIGEVIILKGVLFETASARLKENSTEALDQAVTTMKRYPELKVIVAGHTDSQGSESYNRQLSQDRANTVLRYMISKGIIADRLQAKGYGSSSPVTENTTSEGRLINRRVELIVQE